jgi:hypothetical protein
MKRIALVIVVLFSFALTGWSLDFDRSEPLKKIGLSDDQIKKVMDISVKFNKEKKDAQLELNILRAQLEKLLASTDPDMKSVEKLLRDSVELKVKSELAEIKKRVEIRKVVGEELWNKLVVFFQKSKEMRKEKAEKNRPDKEREDRD